MNPIVLVVYNTTEAQFKLTQLTYESIRAQDIGPLLIWIVNNGSTDGETSQWLKALKVETPHRLMIEDHPTNEAPTRRMNVTAASIFSLGHHAILGLPNDVILPSNCYSQLLRWPRGFVCASDNGQNEPEVREAHAVSENTPMAVMLVRKWAYDALVAKDGYFLDEGYFHYASDCDLALRMAMCGIRGVQIDTPFWHFGSASLKLAKNRRAMEIQADADRAYFEKKWGFKVDSLEYGQRPADLNFGANG